MEVNTDSIVYLSAAALIWLFGVLVFLPLAIEINPDKLPLIVSLIVFVAFSLFILGGLKRFADLLDMMSKEITGELAKRRKLDKTDNEEKMVRIILEVASIIIVYLLYSPFLSNFHPSINGIALILTLIAILWTLIKRRK
jgi:hypothetical protein